MERKSIKKNTVFNIIKTSSSIIFPLITFPYISRVLLPDNLGKIDFGLSIVSYFSLIATLGITTYAIRECSAVREDKEKLSDTSSQIFTINVITTILAYIFLAITLIFYQKLENYRVLILIQSLSIVAVTLGADWLNSAMEDFKYITLRTVAFQIISLVLIFMFVHQPDDYLKYAVIVLLPNVGASITNIWYRGRYCSIHFLSHLKRDIEWKRHIGPIFYLFVMIFSQTIFNSVDSTMLGLINGDHEVGIYNVAHKVMNIISQVVSSLLWVIIPRMSYYFAEKKYDEVNKLLRKVLGFNMLIGLPCAVGCSVNAEDVIRVVAGDKFIEAAPVLRILMIGFVFSLIGGNLLGNAVLLPSKQEKYYTIVCCITAVVNIIGNYIFIPMFASKAAAGTTAVCGLTIMILLLFKVDKNIKIVRVRRLILTPLIGCFSIIAICLGCKVVENFWIRVIINVAGSVAMYGFIQIILKNELVYDVLALLKKRLRKG